MIDDEKLIEQFVGSLNRSGLEPLFDDAVPPELRTEEVSDVPGMYEWRILPAQPNPWVLAIRQKLPSPYPPLYEVLISRYRFAEFEIGPVLFLANTGTHVFNELADAAFRDKGLSPALLQNGLLQFGRQAGGHYDPVCFDMKRRLEDDAPIVQIDHECVLIEDRIRVVGEIAPSFRAFVEAVIAGRWAKK